MTTKHSGGELWDNRKSQAASWFADLRDQLCTKLE